MRRTVLKQLKITTNFKHIASRSFRLTPPLSAASLRRLLPLSAPRTNNLLLASRGYSDNSSPSSTTSTTAMATLFSVPVAPDPHNPSNPAGSFTCTSPAPSIYLLTFNSLPDNRLTPQFNAAFLLSLDILQHRFPRGVVITTSGIAKFYSNGLDYDNAIKDPTFFPASLFPLWHRLLTYPMPTIALMNGHAFAGGLMTGMFHDYRVFNPHRGYLCLNELDFGAQLRPAMASVFRSKIPMSTFRNMVLESRRYTALEAVKEGLVDGLGGLDDVLKYVAEFKLVEKAKSESYGALKEELYRECVRDLRDACEDVELLSKLERVRSEQRKQLDQVSLVRVEAFEAGVGKMRSKL